MTTAIMNNTTLPVEPVFPEKTHRGRGMNASTYRWHVQGVLSGNTIDKKYTSINQFVSEYGGDATPLNLDKSKVLRLKKKWLPFEKRPEFRKDKTDKLFAKHWGITISQIEEKRPHVIQKIYL